MQVMVRLVQIAAWARLRELGGRGISDGDISGGLVRFGRQVESA